MHSSAAFGEGIVWKMYLQSAQIKGYTQVTEKLGIRTLFNITTAL